LHKVDLFIITEDESVNEALNYGVPMVVVPQQIEQAINGRQVARQEAGVVLADTPPYGKLKPGVLKRSVDLILAHPSYRQNADRLSRSFHAAGGYRQAANILTSARSRKARPFRPT
jgi:UDP:flavonoid glycosyltransferase YjiC (YdhE family)